MNSTPLAFEQRIHGLDLSLFDSIPSQSSHDDRLSWLAVQRAVRAAGCYVYVEIGSYLGGSLQPHFLDARCRKIISIDKRDTIHADNRGDVIYEGNSEHRMLKALEALDSGQRFKLQCYDADVRDLDRDLFQSDADLCFIDGEHTDAAVAADFEFCFHVCKPNATVLIHDDNITSRALWRIVDVLRQRNVPFIARKLGGVTFGIFLGRNVVLMDSHIRAVAKNGMYWLWRQRIKTFVPEWALEIRRNSLRALGLLPVRRPKPGT
jgi:hypothetical protein